MAVQPNPPTLTDNLSHSQSIRQPQFQINSDAQSSSPYQNQ